MIKVYLDSNVIMSLFFERDRSLKRILEASKRRQILAYVSWLSLTEVFRSVSRTSDNRKLLTQISKMLKTNKIYILSSPDRRLSSGSAWTTMPDLDYSDHLHLLIAKRAKVDFFVTYDHELLSIGEFESIVILDPRSFVMEVLGG